MYLGEYTGDTDRDGNACGWGVVVWCHDPLKAYAGTFLNDTFEGIIVTSENKDNLGAFECYRGAYHGRSTYYNSDGTIEN